MSAVPSAAGGLPEERGGDGGGSVGALVQRRQLGRLAVHLDRRRVRRGAREDGARGLPAVAAGAVGRDGERGS